MKARDPRLSIADPQGRALRCFARGQDRKMESRVHKAILFVIPIVPPGYSHVPSERLANLVFQSPSSSPFAVLAPTDTMDHS